MKDAILAILLFSVAGIGWSAEKERFSLSAATQAPWQIPRLLTARQLVSSITAGYDSSLALVQFFERDDYHGDWKPVSTPIPAVTGRAGLAWGIGLHGDPPAGAPSKREGDGKGPAGVFIFGEAFGSESPEALGHLNLPYRQMTKFHYGVDDPASHFYNKIVDARKVTMDWTSAEQMLRNDGLYQLGIVVGHNSDNLPGRGSCIFFHVWRGPGSPTVGCTALPYESVLFLARWLDPGKQPLLIQLPFDVYEDLRKSYLPVIQRPSTG